MAKQVLDVHPGKGMSMSQSNEHLRVASKGAYLANLSGNFDPTREHLNFVVTKCGIMTPVDKSQSTTTRIKKNLRQRWIMGQNLEMDNPIYHTVANVVIGGFWGQMRRLVMRLMEPCKLVVGMGRKSRLSRLFPLAMKLYTRRSLKALTGLQMPKTRKKRTL